jgi:hypothetical protein
MIFDVAKRVDHNASRDPEERTDREREEVIARQLSVCGRKRKGERGNTKTRAREEKGGE